MKSNIAKTLLAGIMLISTIGHANNPSKKINPNSGECLIVIGMAIDEKNEPIDGVEVILFKDNDEMEANEITNVVYHDHNFQFSLDSNQYYTIKISKPGYIDRFVSISTKLNSETEITDLYRFEFDVIMEKVKPTIDDFYLDFPIALISYDPMSDSFISHAKYSKHIKKMLRESQQLAKL